MWTGFHHNRFGHVHLLSDDVNAAAKWYMQNLGLEGPPRDIPKPPPPPKDFVLKSGDQSIFRYLWASAVRAPGVEINIFGKPDKDYGIWWNYPPMGEFEPTKGRAINHMAFSYRDIDPVFERMQKAGVEILEPISDKPEFGFRSFFVQGPDKVLIEVVEAKPNPEGLWE